VLHAAAEIQDAKMTQKSPSAHHRTALSGYIFAAKACIDNRKKLLSSNISSRCSHNMANFGPLMAEISSGVWCTPAKFNDFRVLPSLLQRRRSPEANQTLHDIWPFPGLVRYIYILRAVSLLRNFSRCKMHCVQVLQRNCTALE